MRVIKFDDRAEEQWRKWLTVPRSTDEIIQRLQGDRFSVSAYVCDETIVDTLFRMFDEDFYGEYSKSIIDHIPEKLLLAVHEWVDLLSGVTEDRLIEAINVVASQEFEEDIYQYACDCADENEESHPTPETIAKYIDQYALQWLKSIVREAIESYTSPIAISIYGAGGHCL